MRVSVAIFTLCTVISGCDPTIEGPERVTCRMFASGEAFTAEKRNMRVDGGFLHVVDDEGNVRAFRMIDSDSNAYIGKCDPAQEALKEEA